MKTLARRTLFIHVGPKKTATSSIQNFLRNHDNSVVTYPKVGLYADGSHHKLVYRFFGENRRCMKGVEDLEVLFRKIAIEAKQSENSIVISSEVLADKSRDVGAFIRALIPHVGTSPIDVHILLTCREHFERTASWYNMRVRAPKRLNSEQSFSPDQFLSAHAPEICYAPLVRRLRNTGFPLTALNFHPSETWTKRFFHQIGFQEAQLPKDVDRIRMGLSPKALIAIVAANKVMRSMRERRTALDAFAAMPNSHGPSGFIFGRKAAAHAECMFRHDRSFLQEELGVTVDPPDLQSLQTTFVLNRDELGDIVRASRQFGRAGDRIVELASQYLCD